MWTYELYPLMSHLRRYIFSFLYICNYWNNSYFFSTRLLWLFKCSKLKTSFAFTNSNRTRGARYFPSLICGVTTIIRRTCKRSRSLELLLKYNIAARFSLCQALPDFHSAFAQLFSFRFLYYIGAWNRSSTILLLVIWNQNFIRLLKALLYSHNLSTEWALPSIINLSWFKINLKHLIS